MITNDTQNTATLPVPNAEQVKPESKSKRKREAKAKREVKAIEQALVEWKHGTAPANIPSEAIVFNIGDDTGRKNKQNQAILAKQMTIAAPTATALRKANPSLSVESAEAESKRIGTEIKPIVLARITAAGANSAFIVRRYAESRGDVKHPSLMVKLERVNVETTIERLAREQGMTVAEVQKRLNIKPQLTIEA